ncbi:NADP-dependent 3-hydroxy acid dehydrogenase YdfG [Rhizomicrobium palustre]|jgi:NADP-dependent 3-hydroxy acid dehydrogenase YdfG|uniref:NADP-dependent 3-hydroxy acid dehydrogenase YdfG n=1 Tax=Rhizomicrobium palustre TaxID=189966 RepID=A0A846MVQ2_9PROT|nr:SDR family oxidoreductase [Rhizomicrobium palustre]NIK87241.1 NADP-dependent 3-hydroxy acid dehydrogenase YdfG [Rhizomicrobium palustre]
MTARFSRIAIVTGATSGIGEATVRRFAAEGIAVVGNGRTKEKLVALEKDLWPMFRGVEGDAGQESVIEEMFASAEAAFGPADIVVVNAGRGLGGSVTAGDTSRLAEIFQLNVLGALALMRAAATRMVPRQEQNYPKTAQDIIVIGSVVGRNISPFSALYGSTKHAVHSLTEALRREIGPKGVRVTLVEPGFVLSGFQDGAGYSEEMVEGFKTRLGPLLVGEDVADALHYIVTRPAHVHVGDIVIRPTRQDYP